MPYSSDAGPTFDTWLQRAVFALALSNSSLLPVSPEPSPVCFSPTHSHFNYAFTHAFVPEGLPQQGLPDHLTQNCKPLVHIPYSLLCFIVLQSAHHILFISSLTILPIRMIVSWDQDCLFYSLFPWHSKEQWANRNVVNEWMGPEESEHGDRE